MKRLFEIPHYDVIDGRIIVFCYYPDREDTIEVKINKQDFFRWMDRTDRLEWEIEELDVQHMDFVLRGHGKYKPHEYLEYCNDNCIKRDLYDYILIKGNTRVFEDIQKGFEEICNDYREAI